MKLEHRIAAYLSGPRYTLWTFIKYFEKSKDPAHCRRLHRAMQTHLSKAHREGEVIRCRSIRNGVAFKSAVPGEIPF